MTVDPENLHTRIAIDHHNTAAAETAAKAASLDLASTIVAVATEYAGSHPDFLELLVHRHGNFINERELAGAAEAVSEQTDRERSISEGLTHGAELIEQYGLPR